MAVLFGLLMLFAVIAGCTVVTGRFPRTAATFTLLLWIMTAIFMILGAGEHISVACLSPVVFPIQQCAQHPLTCANFTSVLSPDRDHMGLEQQSIDEMLFAAF